MKYLSNYFKGKKETVYGLAGLGDLYVSAMGGRNSKMGEYLGKGYTFTQAKKKFMKKYTQAGTMAAYDGLDPHDDNKWEEKAEKFARRELSKWL